jgi:peptidoglycan/LPS O-acetylase OafA/YrhL
MDNLEGLRGIAAVWVMIYHAFIYSSLHINLQGSSLMPLFFLLSGFSLSIGYTDHFDSKYALTATSDAALINRAGGGLELGRELLPNDHHYSAVPSQENEPAAQHAPLRVFYTNRLIRTLPMNAVCCCFALPNTFAGFGQFDPANRFELVSSTIQTMIPVIAWTFYLFGSPVNGPMWTISTLMFFWLLFPSLLSRYKLKSDAELLNTIKWMFWLQFWLIVVLFPVFIVIFGYLAAFFWPTTVPYFRLPVFIMGMCAGILCTRHAKDNQLPWFEYSRNCIGMVPLISLTSDLYDADNFAERSSRLAGILGAVLLMCILIGVIIGDIQSNYWLQGSLVFIQLDLIVSLYKSGSRSACSKWLRHSVVQYLGRISMSLYLVHWPIIFYLCWLKHGSTLVWPSSSCFRTPDEDRTQQCADSVSVFWRSRAMPTWGIPVVAVLSVLLASVLHFWIDLPIQERLKRKH